MPTTEPQRKPIGRPKRNPRPRRATTVRIEEDSFAWMNKNLPRAVAMADFINAALRDRIADIKAGRLPRPA